MALRTHTVPYRESEVEPLGGARPQATGIRVAVVDEQPLLRDGVARALGDAVGMRVVLEEASGAALVAHLADTPVDVVLIEPWMHTGDGAAAIAEVHDEYPEIPIIALSSMTDPGHVQQAVALGVSAYVGKGTSAGDLPSIVRHVVAGALVLPGTSGDGRSVLDLTPREMEVLALAAEGLSNSDIGSRLYVTEQTVKFHLGNIYRKLGVANRTEAAHQALRRGLIS